MKVIIVDDNTVFTNRMAELIKKESFNNKYLFDVECLNNGEELVCRLSEGRCADIYFLDVELGDLNGMDIARKIRKDDRKAKIIFVTAYSKYAIQGYTYKAEGYILKSMWDRQLPKLLKKIWEENELDVARKYVIVTNRRHETIYYDDILFIEKEAHESKNVVFYLNGNRSVSERTTLKEVIKKLPLDEFMLVSRKNIVSMRYITRLNPDGVEIDGKNNLEISRTLLSELREKLTSYWGKI